MKKNKLNIPIVDISKVNSNVLLNMADGFFNTAQILNDRLISNPINNIFSAPTAVNLVFACELYFKFLYCKISKNFVRTHDLWDLFTNLPEDIKSKLKINSEKLIEHRDYFVEWRYIFTSKEEKAAELKDIEINNENINDEIIQEIISNPNNPTFDTQFIADLCSLLRGQALSHK